MLNAYAAIQGNRSSAVNTCYIIPSVDVPAPMTQTEHLTLLKTSLCAEAPPPCQKAAIHLCHRSVAKIFIFFLLFVKHTATIGWAPVKSPHSQNNVQVTSHAPRDPGSHLSVSKHYLSCAQGLVRKKPKITHDYTYPQAQLRLYRQHFLAFFNFQIVNFATFKLS